jgi:colicin import membrane protein
MSKDLALQQTEWDLHEANEAIIPLEFTEEIKPDLFGLELEKAQEMTSGLSTTIAEREVLKKSYAEVIELEITAENLPIFKELRLKIVKNRTQGIEKWHTNNKAFYLAGGRFVDAVKNKEIIVNQEMEAKLMDAEKFFENQEKEKARLLNEERRERLKPYIEDVSNLDLSQMSDYDFDDYLLGKKTRFENEQKEREAEALRIQAELDAEIARQKAIEEENAILKAEAEAKELQIKKEREEAEAKQKAIQEEADKKAREEKEKQDAILKSEQEAKAKVEAELQAKKDAEIKAENERKAKVEADKKEAEKLAKAPIKKQLSIWVDSFELPTSNVDNEVSKSIIEKFNAFKNWSKGEIEKL